MKGRRPRHPGREPRKKDGEAGPRPTSGSGRQVVVAMMGVAVKEHLRNSAYLRILRRRGTDGSTWG